MTGRNIVGIDAVRFFAAILVMIFHLGFWSWWVGGVNVGTIQRHFPGTPSYPELIPFLWFGWVGVQIFFVISGFVISISASNRAVVPFITSRFMRIYPTAWICAILIFAVSILFTDESVYRVIFRLINSLVISPLPLWLDGVFWTLVVELSFYSLVSIVLYLWGGRKIEKVAYFLTMISSVFLFLVFMDVVKMKWVFTLFLLQHGVFFAFGVFLSYQVREIRFSLMRCFFLVLSFSFCCLEIALVAEKKLSGFGLNENLWVPILVWCVAMVVMIASAVKAEQLFAWSQTVGATFYFRLAGLMTYPLYLLHSLIGGAVLFLVSSMGFSKYSSLALAVFVALCAAWLVTFFERQINPFLYKRVSALIKRA